MFFLLYFLLYCSKIGDFPVISSLNTTLAINAHAYHESMTVILSDWLNYSSCGGQNSWDVLHLYWQLAQLLYDSFIGHDEICLSESLKLHDLYPCLLYMDGKNYKLWTGPKSRRLLEGILSESSEGISSFSIWGTWCSPNHFLIVTAEIILPYNGFFIITPNRCEKTCS